MDLSNNEVRHIKHGEIEYLEFKAFDEYKDKVRAAFAIRGEREMHFFGDGTDGRLGRINDAIGVDSARLIWIQNQIHSDKFAVVSGDSFPDNVDAMITCESNLSLVTRVADCIAVLVYDPVHDVIANIHSGWRGTIKRIAPKTVLGMMKEYDSRPEDLVIVLCPSIGFDHFEVDKDVRDMFANEFNENYIYNVGEKSFIDAAKYLMESLVEIGVPLANIHDSGICTVCNSDLLYSYRVGGEIDQSYRNAALICLKGENEK